MAWDFETDAGFQEKLDGLDTRPHGEAA